MLKRIRCIAIVVIMTFGLMCTPLVGNKPVVIVSGSMEPAIMTNALTLVHMCKVEDVKIGDIVTYYHDGLEEYVTHRVIEKWDDKLHTKGDANNLADDIYVTDENIFGKNFLVMNFMAPIMEPFIHDREYNKLQAIYTIIVRAAFVGIMILACAYVGYSIVTWVAVFTKKPVPDESMLDTVAELLDKYEDSDKLSKWKRYKLMRAYMACRHQLKEVQSELNKL